MNIKLKSYGGNGFKAHIYNEFLGTERFFIAWGRAEEDTLCGEPRTLGPYETFQSALNAVVRISSALKPLELTVDIKR